MGTQEAGKTELHGRHVVTIVLDAQLCRLCMWCRLCEMHNFADCACCANCARYTTKQKR